MKNFALVRAALVVGTLQLGLAVSVEVRAGTRGLTESVVINGQHVERGWLRVPERRDGRTTNAIEIPFVRFPATVSSSAPPIIYVAGGPGESGVSTLSGAAFGLVMALREVADVIAFDQRGAGQSKPSLACNESWGFPLNEPGDPQKLARIAAEKVRECLTELERRGIDPAAYNVVESADDVEALRPALGTERITLWGISYGTHLALQVIRRHGGHVANAILTGVNGPDHALLKRPSAIDGQLRKLGEILHAEANANANVTNVVGVLQTAGERLAEKPVTVQVMDEKTGQPIAVTVGKWDLQFLTASRLTQTWGLKSSPAFLGALARGDYKPLAQAAFNFRTASVGSTMPVLMLFSSGVSPARITVVEYEARKSLLGNAINFPYSDLMKEFSRFDAGESVRSEIRSDVPVLFVSGTLDGRTPPEQAEEIRRGFSRNEHLVVEGASHGYDLFFFATPVKQAMLQFLREGNIRTNRVSLGRFSLDSLDRPRGAR
ncbi:MAG: alpha/beta hydrolase [Verrucomicrobia subdivision 3 bacterium]|nr:alpha/beta hydrolase [Limisphaerales bacterium]